MQKRKPNKIPITIILKLKGHVVTNATKTLHKIVVDIPGEMELKINGK